MGLRDEICKIPKLKNSALAMIDYIESLVPQIEFEKKNKRWVPTVNFVTFTIQHARSQNIIVSFRGNPKEFIEFEELELREGMGKGAYSECTFSQVAQLPAITTHIRNAFELYSKGSKRIKRKLMITKVLSEFRFN